MGVLKSVEAGSLRRLAILSFRKNKRNIPPPVEYPDMLHVALPVIFQERYFFFAMINHPNLEAVHRIFSGTD